MSIVNDIGDAMRRGITSALQALLKSLAAEGKSADETLAGNNYAVVERINKLFKDLNEATEDNRPSICVVAADDLRELFRKSEPGLRAIGSIPFHMGGGVLDAVEFVRRLSGAETIVSRYVEASISAAITSYLQRYINKQYPTQLPSAADLVRFNLREVFVPEDRKEQLQPYPNSTYFELMAQQGYNQYHAESYWAAHWELPPIAQLNEMLWRSVFSARAIESGALKKDATQAERDAYDVSVWTAYVTRNDYLPVAIPLLRDIIYAPYTRVDIRRMWELDVLDDAETVRAYRDIGYTIEKSENLTLFAKLERSIPDIRKRYSNGWMNSDDVRKELLALGLQDPVLSRVYETIVKADKSERTARERDLTKAEILKGAKSGLFSRADALLALESIGYDKQEAEFLLTLAGIVAKGDPDDAAEMFELVHKLRGAAGVDDAGMPAECIECEQTLREAQSDVVKMRGKGASAEEIEKAESLVEKERQRLGALRRSYLASKLRS